MPEVFGAIGEKWRQLGGANSPLKLPFSNEVPTFDGIGRWQQFQGGMISWYPTLGAFVVWGAIGELWLQLRREQFGYPITDELIASNPRGRYNHFRAMHLPDHPEGSIFWTQQTGAHQVYGHIRNRWAALGWDRSKLGFPTSGEYDTVVNAVHYRQSDFEYGYIRWSPQTGARETITSIPIDDGTELHPVDDD